MEDREASLVPTPTPSRSSSEVIGVRKKRLQKRQGTARARVSGWDWGGMVVEERYA
jgi:hypothetical protein